MLTPYVQDVSKWINYYNRNGTSNSNVSKPEDNLQDSSNGGLAQESNMSVNKVEPRGPAPQAPNTGPSATLHNITPSQESLVQAAYTAKRIQMEGNKHSKGKPSSKKKGAKKVANGGVTKKIKNQQLFGTPIDIFKKKISFKKKKKN